MKLPIPEELTNQLAETRDLMSQIVTELGGVKDLLQELVDIEKARQ